MLSLFSLAKTALNLSFPTAPILWSASSYKALAISSGVLILSTSAFVSASSSGTASPASPAFTSELLDFADELFSALNFT